MYIQKQNKIKSKICRNNSDDWGGMIPTSDVLTNVEDENQFENPLHKQSSHRAHSITNLQSKRRSHPQTIKDQRQQSNTQKQPKSPSPNRNMSNTNQSKINPNTDQSDSEYFADIQPDCYNNQKQKQKPHITPITSRRDSAPNMKKKPLPSDYIFRSEESMEKEKQQINEARNINQKRLRPQNQFRKTTAPAPTKSLPPNNGGSRTPSPPPHLAKKPLPKVILYHI